MLTSLPLSLTVTLQRSSSISDSHSHPIHSTHTLWSRLGLFIHFPFRSSLLFLNQPAPSSYLIYFIVDSKAFSILNGRLKTASPQSSKSSNVSISIPLARANNKRSFYISLSTLSELPLQTFEQHAEDFCLSLPILVPLSVNAQRHVGFNSPVCARRWSTPCRHTNP